MRKSLQGISHMVQFRTYPGLPNELTPYYAYITDCGHSIMAIAKVLLDTNRFHVSDLSDLEAPVPVKYVLSHSYTIVDGHLIIDVPYGEFGIEVDEDYYED